MSEEEGSPLDMVEWARRWVAASDDPEADTDSLLTNARDVLTEFIASAPNKED